MNKNREIRWKEDIEYLSKELQKKHKNLFFKNSKKVFENNIEDLKCNLKYFDDYEIYIQISKIIASIKDAHTSVSLPIRLLLPFQCYWFFDGVYITDITKEYEDILYGKMIAINGMDMESVIDRLSSIISYENDSFLKSQLPKYIPAIELLYGLEILDEINSVEITIQYKDGTKKNVQIKSLPLTEAQKELNDKNSNSLKYYKLPLYRRDTNKYYWFNYIKEEEIIYFKYNRCKDMEIESVVSVGKRIIKLINKNPIQKIIIDLRNNFGGNSTLLDTFIQDLSKTDKINKKGSIFVIVGRESFSSALLNMFSLKENTNAIFVGEESGGKPNCYGEVERFRLINSGLNICYSTKYYELISGEDPHAFIPDIKIDLTIDNYKKAEDPCLSYILRV
ncbi:peptidase, S41 family [Clostridium putrefaciens]|uniref:Peptidase, S41 family n=1 Tax=Clostridium putrefaciens TaxID=99675 RepID=A0A381J6Z6_9CLOT|nr:S41 family peptidase [Clostridium putrefaciens]SUY46753.1 peptidase, S41 family [Clostridium putrefaciens]